MATNNSGPFYPRGRYRCEILDQGLTKASTGTVQVAFKVRVLESVNPPGDVEAQYERSVFLPATERTMEYLIPKLETLGYTRDSIRHLDLNSPQCHDLRGTLADFFCKHENDRDGAPRERWDVASGGGGKALDLTPPDAQALRNLDMLFSRARKHVGGPNRPTAVRTQPPPPGDPSDADIPPDWV